MLRFREELGVRRSKSAAGKLSGASPFSSHVAPQAPRLRLRDRIGDWIFPIRHPEAGPVVLGQRRVYILPTRAGFMFGTTLLLMLVGAINYNLGLGYVLAFLLAGTGIVSILHCWRNLARSVVRPGKAPPVFVGDLAEFAIRVENPGSLTRRSLAIKFPGQHPVFFDVPSGGTATVAVRLPATHRGMFRPGRFSIYTTYPLGLFHAWANVDLDIHCLVYPRPEAGDVALPPAREADGQGSAQGAGEEDFAGLRTYQPGDSPRRIAWKAFARNEVFLSKQFAGSAVAELWLDFSAITDALGTEEKLSRIARWVIDAEIAGHRYGLRLPGLEFDPDTGSAQRDRCLQALAVFDRAKT
jgi:uncharacterized protein (DUF58 family)